MKHLKNIFILLLLISNISFTQVALNPEISQEQIKYHIEYLASDELEGRMTGTDALYKAAEYIKNEFVRYGLKPFFGNSYFQEFPFIAGINLTDNNYCKLSVNNTITELELRNEYIPASFADNKKVSGEIVFAGYGISADDLNYNDYKDISVKDKIVLVLRNHPDQGNPHSKFDKYSSLRYKAATARDHGAAGIILLNGYDKDSDDLIDFKYDNAAAMKDISVIHIKRNFVEKLFEFNSVSLKNIQEEIDSTKIPNSFELNKVSVEFETGVKVNEVVSWNVGGYLPAAEQNYSEEYLVLGAHFDHLGWGGSNSLYMGDEPMIHNGADDNASGTTGLLEIAEKFASQKDQLKRPIIFTAFSGEELGLLGSNFLVNNFPIPIENSISMINMDMIGRLNEKKDLIIYGTGTSTNWKDILNKKNFDELNLTFNDEGFGPSDHSSFYGKQIPVLFFFTGTHQDYHKPSDDADKINAEGQETVLNYIYSVASEIVNSETKPDYLAVERKERGRMTGSKVYVGTVPDFAGDVDGYKLGGVTEGSPADAAGLKAGDIIKQFGGKKVSNIYDFTYAIADFVPGDKVEVIALRGEEELKFEIELGSR